MLHVSVRRYRCPECAHVWRQNMSAAADPRAKLSRAAVRWAEHTLGTGSGARSRATWWGATRRVREPSA